MALVSDSAWIAVASYLAAIAWMDAAGRRGRGLWTLTAVLFLVHGVIAMTIAHGGSHQAAILDTARKTDDLLGVPIGVGLYFNYVFIGILLADSIWWLVAPQRRAHRPAWVGVLLHAFVAFMVINGAIVFANSPLRWIALMALAAIAASKVARGAWITSCS